MNSQPQVLARPPPVANAKRRTRFSRCDREDRCAAPICWAH